MGVMDRLFRPTQQQQAPAQQQNAGGGNGPASNEQTPAIKPGAGAGSSSQLEQAGAGDKGAGGDGSANAPLDQFKDLWKTDDSNKDGGKPKPYLDIDRAKLVESSKKLKYSQLIPPELVAKALSGDTPSFHSIIDTVGQSATANAIQAALSLMERGLSAAEGRVFERLPSELKRHSLADSAASENPGLNHEAVQPMLQMVQQQMAAKYPEASTSQIQKMAKDYITETFKALQPQDPSGTSKKPARGGSPLENLAALQTSQDGTDWDKEMGML